MYKFKKGKSNFVLVALVVALLVMPSCASASIVFETTEWIEGRETLSFEFTADKTPFTYQLTLTDLSESPYFEAVFVHLYLRDTDELIGGLTGFGSFTFPVLQDELYYINLFGIGGGYHDAGLINIEVASVPIPGAVWLLGSGLIGLVVLRRREH